MKKFLLITLAIIIAGALAKGQTLEQLPENPEPGKCYVRCITPDVYETVEDSVLVKPAYKVLKIVPAEYKWEEERIMVKPASKKFEYVPAEFEKYEEQMLLEEGYNKVTLHDPVFSDHIEKVEIEPASQKWEYTLLEDCESEDPFDCRVICYREFPAVFTQIPYQKLDKDASSTTKAVEKKMQTVKKMRIAKEAYVKEIEIPAEYKTIQKKVLVSDERVVEKIIPAEYRTYSHEVLVEKGGLTVWKEVECELVNYNVLPIYYELASARLTPESITTIDNTLLKLMKDKPEVKVELSSHTDSRGTAESNMDLSQRRAQSVVNYLISKGINPSRLVAKGYGETKLLNRCSDGVTCTEKEHQQNRRTEFRVINW